MTFMRRLARALSAACAMAALPVHARAQLAEAAGLRVNAPVALGRAELVSGVSAERIASAVGPRTALGLESVLSLPALSGRVWIGSALEGSPGVDSLLVRPLARVGVWQAFRGLRVTVQASTHEARVGGRASGTFPAHLVGGAIASDSGGRDTLGKTSHDAMWSDVEGRVSWRRGPALFAATMGVRPSVDSYRATTWGNLRASYELTSNVALVAAGGSNPARIGLGIPASPFLSVALRVVPWRSPPPPVAVRASAAFAVTPAGAGNYRVTYREPSATSVELSGDFARWKPIALTRAEDGTWETTLRLPPGTYHMNVRLNGDRWFAPPGLPEAQDDFNGTVGVLVVPAT